ncbi:Uncharacterised protein [Escherichia coli]|uniref:Uncharacterized protein n=1 Tax=Escherichia coli TaxID=562 RepID=A0A377A854_ECOLX|nr:Uncharacterised protein [Escherichia coli]
MPVKIFNGGRVITSFSQLEGRNTEGQQPANFWMTVEDNGF